MRGSIEVRLAAGVLVLAVVSAALVVLPEVLPASGPAPDPARPQQLLAVGDRFEAVPPAPTVFVFIPTPTPAPPTPTPAVRRTARPVYADTVANAKAYARSRLGATQYACIDHIFTYESKWNPLAYNSRSGAYGIPQAVPGSKMATFGSNWRTSPLTQVKWGIWYVNSRYGSACDAWAFIQAHGWY